MFHAQRIFTTFLIVLTVGTFSFLAQVGKAYGQTTYLVTTFERVTRGTEGAVSLEGTLAGIAAAVLFAGIALALGQVGGRQPGGDAGGDSGGCAVCRHRTGTGAGRGAPAASLEGRGENPRNRTKMNSQLEARGCMSKCASRFL